MAFKVNVFCLPQPYIIPCACIPFPCTPVHDMPVLPCLTAFSTFIEEIVFLTLYFLASLV